MIAWNDSLARATPHPVDEKKPNAWGLYDMHGNVWEWCSDYGAGLYTSQEAVNPMGPADSSSRVLSGGAWRDYANITRSAFRNWVTPDVRNYGSGFRVARTLVGVVPREASTKPEVKTAPPLAVAPFDADAAKRHQVAWAKHLRQEVEVTNSIGMKLVLIPAGEFLMGSPDSDSDANFYEKPQHQVKITRPFYLGSTEVTQAQYEKIIGNNPSRFTGDANRPVEQVSWDDAVEFCRRLSQREGEAYRLPTEAEWEYACRAGTTTPWSWGGADSLVPDHAWYLDNSQSTTHGVGQKRANSWNLHDMHGNVWEWCSDWHGTYTADEAINPTGPDDGVGRVQRGGAWSYGASFTYSAFHYLGFPGLGNNSQGFRIARTP